MTQVLERPSRDTRQLVAGRKKGTRGFPVPMPDPIEPMREGDLHSETMILRRLPKPIIEQLSSTSGGADRTVADGFAAALKSDLNALIDQTKETLWFLPKWTWSPAAVVVYLTIIVVALYRLLACEISR